MVMIITLCVQSSEGLSINRLLVFCGKYAPSFVQSERLCHVDSKKMILGLIIQRRNIL